MIKIIKHIMFFIIPIVIISFMSCQTFDEPDWPEDFFWDTGQVMIQVSYIWYENLENIIRGTDYLGGTDGTEHVILGSVISQGEAFSWGGTKNNVRIPPSKHHVQTPYVIEVKDVYYSNGGIEAGTEIDFQQYGINADGVTISSPNAPPLVVGEDYILFLQASTVGETGFYNMTHPVQGYARVLYNRDSITLLQSSIIGEVGSWEIHPWFEGINSLDKLAQIIKECQ